MRMESMKDIERQKTEKVSETGKMKEQASRIETDIAEVYSTLESLPDGLDQEIVDQVKVAREAAQAEAGKDGEDLERAQEKTNQEMRTLREMAEKKAASNETAVNMLDRIKAKYGQSERRSAISELNRNTELGEGIIAETQRTMEEASRKLEEMRKIINNS